MKVLLIGGTGFFGKSILDAFKRNILDIFRVSEIIVVSRNSKNFKINYPELLDDNISFLDMDISNTTYIPDFDYVIHAASSTDKRDYILDELNQLKNIELGASNFTKLILKKSQKIKILYCSSGAVYGQQPDHIQRIKESHKFIGVESLEKAKRIYALGKRKAENEIIKLSQLGYSCVIARCFSFFGKYLPKNQHFAYGNFLSSAEIGNDIIVKARNKVYRSYMSADDLVISLFILLNHANEKISIFNVGSSKQILIHDLADKIGSEFGVKVIKNKIDETLPIDRYVPDTNKLEKVIKLSFPSYNLSTL